MSNTKAAIAAHKKSLSEKAGIEFKLFGASAVSDPARQFPNGLRVRYIRKAAGSYTVDFCYTTTKNRNGKYVAYQEVYDKKTRVGSRQFFREYAKRKDAKESSIAHANHA